MTKINALNHAISFLMPIDPHGGFLRIAETIVEVANKNEDVQKSFREVDDWIRVLPINKETRSIHKRLSKTGFRSNLSASSEGKTLLAVTYLRAMEGLNKRVLPQQLDVEAIEKKLITLPKILKDLETDFVSELLMETDIRAARDPRFFQKIEEALQEIEVLLPQLGNPLKDLLGSQVTNPVLAAQVVVSTSGDYDCGGGIGDVICAGVLIVLGAVLIGGAK
ncbi:hypothetical protein [Chamaesiphon sp. VAR_69_metabat_338]|uniref:hypothetical protein n=1 Tax=Chamaesiphon sp. VAR_69_metabat_338 TaxID=2964704 RepID=UPI00286DA551|nr:hypothetical protein [Chamaesiphon sp. VAR_69_metabat_338]